MELPWSFGPSSIASFVFFIGMLIFVHELGHFLAARFFNVKVLTFSLGFGPPIISFVRGETRYQVALIPLGGFVRMAGDIPGEEIKPEDQDRAFSTAPLLHRAAIALAGPMMNLIFPILCFFVYFVQEPQVIAPVVQTIDPEMPAYQAGLQSGDRVIEIDGKNVWSFDRMVDLVSSSPERSLDFKILRNGKEQNIKVTPTTRQGRDELGQGAPVGRIGVSAQVMGTRIGIDGGLFADGPLLTGDRITFVNGKKVQTLRELHESFQSAKGNTVALKIARPQTELIEHWAELETEKNISLSIELPPSFESLEELGIFSSEMFVRTLVPGGPAARAGLRPLDRIVSINGKQAMFFAEFEHYMRKPKEGELPLKISRRGEMLEFVLHPEQRALENRGSGKKELVWDLGFGQGEFPRSAETQHFFSSGPSTLEKAQLGILEALTEASRETFQTAAEVVNVLVHLVSGKLSTKNLTSVVGLFKITAQAAEIGLMAYLSTMALVSVNLGIINLLPIPVLDGGHLMFIAIEALQRRPVSPKIREWATIAGMLVLFALMFVALRNDLFG